MKHDLGLTLAYLTTKSNVITKANQWEKLETLDYQEIFVACDLKIGRYRQFTVFIKIM